MAIQGYAEGIQAGVMDTGSAAEVILAESDRMTELVEELLDISKIDMGRQLLAFSEMDIRELLYDGIRAVEPTAASSIAIVPDFPEEPVMVSCDDTRLRRAVTSHCYNCKSYQCFRHSCCKSQTLCAVYNNLSSYLNLWKHVHSRQPFVSLSAF